MSVRAVVMNVTLEEFERELRCANRQSELVVR